MKNLEAVYYTELEPEIITLKSDKRYYVQGYISTIDKDLVNDVLTIEAQRDLHNQIQEVIKKGGFITGDVEHMVFYDENGEQLNYPKVRDEKGNLIIPELKFVESELRDNGVWVKAEVNKHLPTFKTIWKSIEDGFLNGFSVAVNAIETVTKRVNNEMVNFISKLKLLNITMTGTPCNPNARMQPVLKSLINGENMILKHKYIRREGKPGDYTYYYKDEQGKETSSKDEPDEQTKNKIDKEERQKKHKEIANKIEKVASDQQKMVLYTMQSGDEFLFLQSMSKEKEITRDTIDYHLKLQIDPERGIMEDQDNELLNYAKDKGWVEYNKEDDRYYLTTDKPTKKSIYTNLKKLEGGKMGEEQKLFLKPDEEVNDNVDTETPETETETNETEEPKENVELKSAIISLKSELKKLNSDNLALKTELKTLTERLEKIEKEPIKKSLIADKSKMLGITETSNLREINALDLI